MGLRDLRVSTGQTQGIGSGKGAGQTRAWGRGRVLGRQGGGTQRAHAPRATPALSALMGRHCFQGCQACGWLCHGVTVGCEGKQEGVQVREPCPRPTGHFSKPLTLRTWKGCGKTAWLPTGWFESCPNL